MSGRDTIPAETPMVDLPDTTDELHRLWDDPPGLWGKLKAVQNDAIGVRLMATGFFFLILGGSIDSVVMRLQLAVPNNDLVSPQLYNELFTNHGSVTMFLVILPIFEGFAILTLPLLLGTREMPFPRLGAFAYYTFLMGGLLYYSSTLFSLVPDAGWFAYTPLSLPEFSPDRALDFWVLGLGVAEIGAIAAAIEIIISVLKTRAPGMTLSRVPLFAWAMLVTAFMILFAFTPVIVGSLLLELERGFDMQFFTPELGGSTLLWQHLFWIFGHPEVYIQFLPATGIVSMLVPVFARRRMVGYPWLVAALIGVGFLSFGLWAHHMFTVGLEPITASFFSAASIVIGIPAAVQIFAWLATIWSGRVRWNTPFLFVVGFLALFVLGGITGIMVASVPFDLQAHDSYFVVGHLHYVLIGGVAFPIFAGVYYWFPKFTGRMLSERLGKWNFWLLFVGVNVTFFPMHIVGLMGMPRRISTYPEGLGWETYNLISTIGVFVIVPGIAVFVANVAWSYFKGREAGPNPWDADTLEWALPSPPPSHAFSVPPVVASRHPLWDQHDLHAGTPRLERFVEGLGQWPLQWRAVLITRTGDAQPEEVFRVANPSIWPFVAAIGTVGVFVAELLKLRLLAVGALAFVAAAVVKWNWPEPAPVTEAEEEAFERAHGIPVHVGGSWVVARWGMGLVLLILGIALGAFLLSYFYLQVESQQWPPAGVARPSLPWAAVAAVLAAAAAFAAQHAHRSIRRGSTGGLRAGVVATMGAAAVAMTVQVLELQSLGFGASDHAYGSIFYTLGGFAIGVAGAGVLLAALVLRWSFEPGFTVRRHVPVTNLARFWTAAAVTWFAAFGTLYVTPWVT